VSCINLTVADVMISSVKVLAAAPARNDERTNERTIRKGDKLLASIKFHLDRCRAVASAFRE